jgi:hypothetical protein
MESQPSEPPKKKEILNRRQARWLAFGKEKKGKRFHITKDMAQKMIVNKLYAKTIPEKLQKAS